MVKKLLIGYVGIVLIPYYFALEGSASLQPMHSFALHFSDAANPLRIVEFSDDGKRLFVASLSYGGEVWNTETGEKIQSFFKHKEYISSFAFSADGQFAISGDYAGETLVWEVATGSVLSRFTHPNTLDPHVDHVSISPEGKLALINAGNETYLWDVHKQSLIRQLEDFHQKTFAGIRWFRDGKRVLLVAPTVIYDVVEQKPLAEFGDVNAFLPLDEKFITVVSLSALGDSVFEEYDLLTNKKVGNPIFLPEGRFEYNPQKKLIAQYAAKQNQIRLKKYKEGNRFSDVLDLKIEGFENWVLDPVISPDGGKLAVAVGDTAYVYDISNLTAGVKQSLEYS